MRNFVKPAVNSINIAVLAAVLSACSSSTVPSTVSGTIAGQSSSFAAPVSSLTVCSGYGCILEDKFNFSASEEQQLRAIMSAGHETASSEREAIQTAIAAMETMARRRLRYKPDIEFSYQKNSGKRGQMDCIDESLNTISYLKYLQGKNLLKYHKAIRRYAERGFILDGRYPHKSARIRDNSGVDWAVDSWKGKDGAKPEMMLLAKWYKGRNNASNY